MFALWRKLWIAVYKREVRTQLQYLKIHRKMLEEEGFIYVDVDMTIHMLNGLHRGTTRRTQIKITFTVAVLSGIAWIVSMLIGCGPNLLALF
ncbi:MAG: hypothetical protein HQ508_00955 [Candidatus Marinimicrobia bacterium]|nr:hypothetical protein [Candidatus Neomarinimicrobiota bacterium]